MPSPMNKTMRQGQQHRRGGGRGPSPQNALARNYESNGPDVKLRGTAAQIRRNICRSRAKRSRQATWSLLRAISNMPNTTIVSSWQPDRRWVHITTARAVVMAVTSLTAGMVVEICRGSGASMSVPKEVTGPRPITMLKPIPTSQTRTVPIR